jgi:hypothetical protein
MPKKKDKGGRPTLMTESTINKLEQAFSNGASDKEACFFAGISHQTLYNYQEKNPEFVERKEGLKDSLKYQAKVNIADRIRSKRLLDFNTSTWYLERRDKDFSLKTQNENNTRVELVLPEERREEIKNALKEI